MRTLSFIVVLAAFAGPALASENRQLGAHEHGVGHLNIAFDGQRIAIELHVPGADIVGFEYEAKSAEDRAKVDAAVATLARPLDLFVLPAAARCSVVQASAGLESEHGEEHHENHDGDHAHESHDEHKHNDHDRDEHAHEDGHTEFHAEYMLDCASPTEVENIEFAYFDAFPDAKKLEVQVITAAGASAFDVTHDAPSLDLRGMF